ncbi:MAG: ABC transporter substrate-binding protein [Pseudomonadota bacterium]|nr:ABC transporter substrate-binding protein [Pseudomonadota bacterium]
MRLTYTLLLLALLVRPAFAADDSDGKLTVLLDWFVNPDHAALVIARERGLFAQAGLEVELVAPADPSAPPRLVAAGQGDIAITYQPQLHVQVAQGLPLVRIATLAETPLNALVALKDGPVKSIADLKGRTVGFSVGGFEDALLATMLGQEGLSLGDVTLVNINFALSQSPIAGKVDAVIGAFRNFELNQLDIEGRPGIAFFPEEHGVPVYDELVAVAKSDRVDEPALRRFVDALEQATLWLTNHPDEAWKLFAATQADLDNELNRRAWRDTLPRLAKRPGALDRQRYARFAAFMKEAGLIGTIPPLESYAVELD